MNKLELHRKKLVNSIFSKKARLDKGIIELITLLNYFNIETEMSCWGHKDRGFGYPCIDCLLSSKLQIDRLILKDIQIKEFNVHEIYNDGEEFNYNVIRITPKDRKLIKGRKQINRLKSDLKKRLRYERSKMKI